MTFTSTCCSSFKPPLSPYLPLLVLRPAISNCTSSLPTHHCRRGGGGRPAGGEPSRRSHRTIPEISLNRHLRIHLPRGGMGYRGWDLRHWPEDGEKQRRAAVAQMRGLEVGVGEPRCCCGDHMCSDVHRKMDGALAGRSAILREPVRASKVHEMLVKR